MICIFIRLNFSSVLRCLTLCNEAQENNSSKERGDISIV